MESKIMTTRFATESQASASEISQKEKTKDTNDCRQKSTIPNNSHSHHYNSPPLVFHYCLFYVMQILR